MAYDPNDPMMKKKRISQASSQKLSVTAKDKVPLNVADSPAVKTVAKVRNESREGKKAYAIDALGRRNYAKDGKRYIEMSPGSNKFGNFQSKSAAKAEQEAMTKKKATPTPKPKEKPTPPTKTSYSAGDHQRGQSTKTTSGKTTSGPPQIGSGGRVMGSKAEEAGRMSIKRRQSAPPVSSSSTSPASTGSNMVFSPMLGKMVPDQRPALKALPTDQDKKKKSKSWLDKLFEGNWEKYNK